MSSGYGRGGGSSYSSVHVVPDFCRCNIVGPNTVSSAPFVPAHHVVGFGSRSAGGIAHLEAKGTGKDGTQHGAVAAEEDAARFSVSNSGRRRLVVGRG